MAWTWRRITGVRLATGECIPCDQVVLCTGTFLSACILLGKQRRPAGRMLPLPSQGTEPSTESLGASLARAGFQLARLKTGTPPQDFSSRDSRRARRHA